MRTKEKYLTEYAISVHLTVNERKQKGSFWTPPDLALRMAKEANYTGGTVLDPAVGGGALLAAMLDTYPDLQEEDVFGVDIDPKAIELCKKLFPYGNFKVGDSLKDDIGSASFWGINEEKNL
jgi:predicted RNA methylase